MKKLFFCAAMFAAMMLTACGGSDKSSNPYAKIAGSWKCDYDNDCDIRTYDEFGIGTVKNVYYNGKERTGHSMCLIDERTNQLMVYDTWKEGEEPWGYPVISITESKMIIDGGKGEEKYIRIK